MEERNYKLDNFKGILIYLVVLAHLTYSLNYYNSFSSLILTRFIYSFHMPLFLIISGYFSKNITSKNLKKLIVIFFFVNLSYIIFDYIIYGTFNLLSVKYSAWYLLALLLFRTILKLNKFIEFLSKNRNISLFIIFIISILSGFINIPLIKIINYSFFFFFGYFLDLSKINFDYQKSLVLAFLIILILLFVSNILPVDLKLLSGETFTNNYYFLYRIMIYLLDILLFIFMYNIIPNNPIRLLTKWGRNSIYIYSLHRILTILIADYLNWLPFYSLISFVIAILLCSLFSGNKLTSCFSKIVTFINDNIKCIINIILCLSIIIVYGLFIYKEKSEENFIIDSNQYNQIKSSITLGFVGDLILLENQVNNSYTNNEYNFDYMFEEVKDYFKQTDYMIGDLEGPVDDEQEYSVGNFDDGKEIYLNYPSEFLSSIKKSGIDLVTIANNHLLDKNINGFKHTLKNLTKKKIDYLGTKNKRRSIVNIEGLKIGVLAYTYGLNNISENEQIEKYSNITNYIVSPDNKYFRNIKKMVEKDFNYLKKSNVDIIVVLPHYGTQFSKESDYYQKTWNKIFSKNGADIVFGCHTHSVQPIEYLNNTLIFNSVGNFVNSYIGNDGDISFMAKVYIDIQTKKVVCGSAIPLLAVKSENYGYYSLPVYKGYKSKASKQLKKRLNYANKIVTKVALGNEVKIKNIEKEYFYFKNGYKKNLSTKFVLDEEDKNNIIYKLINDNNSICFIGDSITEGTKNGQKPWFLSLMENFSNKKVYNFSKGGYKSEDIIYNFGKKIKNTSCDISFINIGTNDIRYSEISEDKYVNNIKQIINLLKDSKIVLLSPWRPLDFDYYYKINTNFKKNLYDKYDTELSKLVNNQIYYVNTNQYIRKNVNMYNYNYYMLDGIHPNNNYGIDLYSASVVKK